MNREGPEKPPPDSRVVRAAIAIILRPAASWLPDVPTGVHPGTTRGSAADWHVLITQRPAGVVKGSAWEFPGGKVEPNEEPRAAVVREVREEIGLAVHPLAALSVVTHAYAHATVQLHPWACAIDRPGATTHNPWPRVEQADMEPRALQVAAARWVGLDTLPVPGFLEANGAIINAATDWAVGWEQPICEHARQE